MILSFNALWKKLFKKRISFRSRQKGHTFSFIVWVRMRVSIIVEPDADLRHMNPIDLMSYALHVRWKLWQLQSNGLPMAHTIDVRIVCFNVPLPPFMSWVMTLAIGLAGAAWRNIEVYSQLYSPNIHVSDMPLFGDQSEQKRNDTAEQRQHGIIVRCRLTLGLCGSHRLREVSKSYSSRVL